MHIEWNKVTWLSKITAIILFVGIFFLGFWLGNQKRAIYSTEVSSVATTTAVVSQKELAYTGLLLPGHVETSRSYENGMQIWSSKDDILVQHGLTMPVHVWYPEHTGVFATITETTYSATHGGSPEGMERLVWFAMSNSVSHEDSLLIATEIEPDEGWSYIVAYFWDEKTEKWKKVMREKYEALGSYNLEEKKGLYRVFVYNDYIIFATLSETTSSIFIYDRRISRGVNYQGVISADVAKMGFADKEFSDWLKKTIEKVSPSIGV